MRQACRAILAGQPLTFFAVTALAIAFAWWWLGRPVALPPSPLAANEKLYCVSYAPFRDGQDPLIETTQIPPQQIDEDLKFLARYTDCIRTYSVENGLDKVPEIAQRYGLKVMQGIWLSNKAARNRAQMAVTVALAKKYPDVIRAVIVGNEVLLRGEMSAPDLGAIIREVKAQITQPVTYADVWEFWLRYADLQNAVDFVTIHILPYWEDFPLPASRAAAHVDAIRKKVAAAIPNKEIVIGEFGWPSHGRMREGALPSPSNQARAIEETLTLGKRENFRVNIIEAFDQPWKRALEGSTGRYWGIFDRSTQGPKFNLGGAVSNHPHWLLGALFGILLAALTFGIAATAGGRKNPTPHIVAQDRGNRLPARGDVRPRRRGHSDPELQLRRLAALADLRAGCRGGADRLRRRLARSGATLPTFAAVLGRSGERRGGLHWALGGVFIVLVLLALQAALGLVFDPRYRDFPFAPLTAAVVPFLVLMIAVPRPRGARAVAETVAGVALIASAGYIAINESFANWQAVWFCAGIVGLGVILLRARDVPDSK